MSDYQPSGKRPPIIKAAQPPFPPPTEIRGKPQPSR